MPRRMMAGLAILSLAGLLTACSTGTPDGAGPGVSSASSTGSAATAANGAVAGDPIAAQIETALARSGSVTITSTSATPPQRMLVTYTPSTSSFRFTSPPRGFADPVDAVAELIDPTTLMDVGGTLFMAANPAKLPRPWLRVSRTASDEWATFLRQNLSATRRNVNPYMIATMFGAADQVWERPAEGTGTRYQVVLKDQNILKVMSADDAERLKSAVTGLTQICDITLDEQHRPVSLRISVSGSDVTQSQTYTGWGGPVTMMPPASTDVMDTPMLSTLGYTTAKVLLTK